MTIESEPRWRAPQAALAHGRPTSRPAGQQGGRPGPCVELDEHELALALASGAPNATRQAWDHFSPLVRRILRRALGPGADVEDVVQEVFLRFFEKVGSLREDAALRAFLVAITINALRGELRRRRVRRIVRFVDPAELPELRVVDADPDARAALERFYGVLDRLRQSDRIAFVLRVIEGMPLAEIAQALDVSVPTVRRRIARAKERVRYHVEREPLLTRYAQAGCTLGRHAPGETP